MGKILETKVLDFSQGMTDDLRETDTRYCALCKHFDIHSKRHALIPYRDSEDGSSGGDTDGLSQFLYYGTKIFALGHNNNTNDYVKVFEMSTFTGNTWSATANGVGATVRSPDIFTEYKGYGYGWANTTGTTWRIWKADLSGAQAFTENSNGSTTYTVSAAGSAQFPQPVVHSKDDALYFAYDNVVLKNSIVSPPTDVWTTALTLPSKYIITAMCEFGNYLAIACKSASGLGNSVVYLWDRDSSLTTLSESIDWGEGSIKVLEQLEGMLVGVSIVGDSSTAVVSKIVFKAYAGGGAQTFKEFITSTNGIVIRHQQKANGKLLFIIGTQIKSENFSGIVSVGKNLNGTFAVSLNRLTTNTDSSSVSTPQGFALINDYMFTAYKDASNVWTVGKTDDAATYTASATYESLIFNLGDSSVKKKLHRATVMTEYLPSAGQVILKYKKDEETSWTTIFTEATDNSVSHTAINIESSGATLPTFKEIQFQILSTGGAVITGFSFEAEVIDSRI